MASNYLLSGTFTITAEFRLLFRQSPLVSAELYYPTSGIQATEKSMRRNGLNQPINRLDRLTERAT